MSAVGMSEAGWYDRCMDSTTPVEEPFHALNSYICHRPGAPMGLVEDESINIYGAGTYSEAENLLVVDFLVVGLVSQLP